MSRLKWFVLLLSVFLFLLAAPVFAAPYAGNICCSANGVITTCKPELRNITPPICALGMQTYLLRGKPTSQAIATGSGQFYVEGSVGYEDYYNVTRSLRYAPVYVYEYHDIVNILLGMTFTDGNGNFLAGPYENKPNGTDVQVVVESTGPYFRVTTDNFLLQYSIFSNVSRRVPDSVVDMGLIKPDSQQNGAWAAYDALMSGWLYPYYNFNYSAPSVRLRWPDMKWLIFTVPHGAYYVHGDDIYLGLDAATSPDVINHEYGHFLMYSLYNNWLPATENCSNHSAFYKSSEKCAWVEGWANFYPALIFNKTQFDYLGHWFIPVEETILGDTGDDVEGRVTGFLNDLVDQNNEGYDTATFGTGTIWSIINSTRVQNLSEFWEIWKSRGNNASAGLGALFQNLINYCSDSDLDGFEEWPCGDDCNDSSANINPSIEEICNGVDDNCNGLVDEGFDADGDGFTTCNGDCNDSSAIEHPGQVWYKDSDNDGYSDGTTVIQCFRPSGYGISSELISVSGDCNDSDPSIHPDAIEFCDGKDNNCNSLIDENCCKDECTTGSMDCNGNFLYTCGDYDTDGCLEWPIFKGGSGSEDCGIISFCRGGFGVASCISCGGWANCNQDPSDGCEVDLTCDETNCGSCGFSCKTGQLCSSRRCLNFPVLLRGDANNDCRVDIFDLATVGLFYGLNSSDAGWDINSDFNADSRTDVFDLAIVGLGFGKRCEDVNETHDERQRAADEILRIFNQTNQNFAIWPPGRWELNQGDTLMMSAGIKNNASDGQNHSFVVNVFPDAVSSDILRRICVDFLDGDVSIHGCKLDHQTNLAKFMSSLINWSKTPFVVDGNGTGFNNITISGYAPAGTYLFGVLACRSDGTGIDIAEKCTTATHNWGGVLPLEILLKPIRQ